MNFFHVLLAVPIFYNWIVPGFMIADSHKRCGAYDAAFHEYERLLDKCKDRLQRIECKFPRFMACSWWKLPYSFDSLTGPLVR